MCSKWRNLQKSHIVGYQTIQVVAGGFNYVTPTFIPLTEGDLDLQSIKLGAGATDYLDNIQIWDAGGVTINQYFWLGDCWSEDFENPVEGVVVKAGSCFVVESMGDTSVIFAGSVATAETKVPSVTGFTMVGNACPIDIDIQSIKMGKNSTDYLDNIQIWDEGGVTINQYFWLGDNWSEDFENPVEGVIIKAGQGFTVEAMNEGAEIILPAAISK